MSLPKICFIISIHAPHAGRDKVLLKYKETHLKFQSTRPMRGATGVSAPAPVPDCYFNPRAPCGARQKLCKEIEKKSGISIHAPREGRDPYPALWQAKR